MLGFAWLCLVFIPLKTLNESNALNATFVAYAMPCFAVLGFAVLC